MAAIVGTAQDKDAIATLQLLQSQNFIFKAQTASPQRGSVRQLTSDYDLTIKKDTVAAWLPYFGRSYEPQINSEGGIKFTSLKFEYKMEEGKKKKWEITIKPTDVTSVKELYLTVFDNSQASLQVISTGRESISFNGYIVEGTNPGKKGF